MCRIFTGSSAKETQISSFYDSKVGTLIPLHSTILFWSETTTTEYFGHETRLRKDPGQWLYDGETKNGL